MNSKSPSAKALPVIFLVTLNSAVAGAAWYEFSKVLSSLEYVTLACNFPSAVSETTTVASTVLSS